MPTNSPTPAMPVERLPALGITVNGKPLLGAPPKVTVTDPRPGSALFGTRAAMLVILQFVIKALAPLNSTAPASADCVEPKFDPVIVTEVPLVPEFKDVPEMFAAAATVKFTPALDAELLVTTIGPEVAPIGTAAVIALAFQEVVEAARPFNVTAPEVPKLLPVMVTCAPIGPEAADRPVMLGRIVNGLELLDTPEAKTRTDADPGLVELGTTALIEPALQLEMLAVDPPKVT
jgi:hypothetical protein